MVGWTDFHSTQVVVPAIVTLNPGDRVWAQITTYGGLQWAGPNIKGINFIGT